MQHYAVRLCSRCHCISAYLFRFAFKVVPTTQRKLCVSSVSRRHVRWYSGVLFLSLCKNAGTVVCEICWNIFGCCFLTADEGLSDVADMRLQIVIWEEWQRYSAFEAFQNYRQRVVKKTPGINKGWRVWLPHNYVMFLLYRTGLPRGNQSAKGWRSAFAQ